MHANSEGGGTVHDGSQENVMNIHRSFYSAFVVNQPKKNEKNPKRTKYLRSVPQDNTIGGKINGNIYIHSFASADQGFGCSQTVLVCTIQVHPSTGLLVD
jgi:hypothetical protein